MIGVFKPLGAVDVYADVWLPPHASHWIAHRLYVGAALFAEMRLAFTWPKWAQDVFWQVT